MNEKGEKVSGEQALFKSIQRINATLDGKQQKECNLWVAVLAETNSAVEIASAPFTPYNSTDFTHKRVQIEQQYASLYGVGDMFPYV